ncbi:hypothetical protein B2J67_06800, partial [Vibrio cholerae]
MFDIMKLTLKHKLIGASLSAVVVMATALTWFSASQLQQQTSNAVYTRADAISSTAAKGISDWISIRKSISTAFNAHIEAQNVVPYLQQARNAGGFDD